MTQQTYDMPKDFTCNDHPKIGGKSAMFVRVLDKKGVRNTLGMLQEIAPNPPAVIDKEAMTTKIYAPDGDLVLCAIPTDDRKKHFVVRLHKEVFSQEVVDAA